MLCHLLLSALPETCLGARGACPELPPSALPPGLTGLFVQPAWVGCSARRSQPGLDFVPNPAFWVLQGSEQLIMNLIRGGEQKPQSDLGFSLTSSLSSDGLSTGCSRWSTKDASCAGAAGAGAGQLAGHLTSLEARLPGWLPSLCLSPTPHPPRPSLLDPAGGWERLTGQHMTKEGFGRGSRGQCPRSALPVQDHGVPYQINSIAWRLTSRRDICQQTLAPPPPISILPQIKPGYLGLGSAGSTISGCSTMSSHRTKSRGSSLFEILGGMGFLP